MVACLGHLYFPGVDMYISLELLLIRAIQKLQQVSEILLDFEMPPFHVSPRSQLPAILMKVEMLSCPNIEFKLNECC